ncbi:MAG: FAD-dependent oxidoreductase [Sphingomonadaceae bacterium]
MHYDVAIVGAGMAGASLAAELAADMSVLLLEAESQPGYHATGRSAAFWHETYGGPDVQPLSKASLSWLATPPAEAGAGSFLSPRGAITLCRSGERDKLQEFADSFAANGLSFEWLDRSGLDLHCPGLRSDWTLGLREPDCADIDVAGVHQAYLRMAARRGTVLHCNAALTSAQRGSAGWTLETRNGTFSAQLLVNAAGAWADEVAALAGVRPIGITPFRRTIVQLRFDRPIPRTLPLTIDVNGQFYFKSDGADGLWLSPHDETPSPPTDAAPEELDIAIAIDRLEQVVEWQVRQVSHKWAGLRSFAPDRLPVYGFDAVETSFFWFAGQGGFGIQTAPAAAKIGASLITGKSAAPMIANIDAGRYAPGRFT